MRIIPSGIGLAFGLALLPAVSAFEPAILNTQAELAFIKNKVGAGAEPWKAGFNRMSTNGFAALTFTPKPRANVECGHYHQPNNGCSDETNSSRAAYSHALMWVITGKTAHAAKAAEILDAWSGKLKEHTNKNAPLQAAWNGAVFPRAALILRNSYPAWSKAQQTRLSTMFDSAFIPLIKDGNPNPNGNWELTYIEALMAIGIFNGDSSAYNKGVEMWRTRVPAYLYLRSDGDLPVRVVNTDRYDAPADLIKFWHNPGVWPDGLCQETCRDLQHVQMGFGAMINAAEIAWHQGLDLYSEEEVRIITALEFHAGILLGQKPPAGLCGGKIESGFSPTWEIAYNHYHKRMGKQLPLTQKWIAQKVRPAATQYHMNWETLTHAELGGSSQPTTALFKSDKVGEATGQIQFPMSGTFWGFPWNGRYFTPDGKRLPLAN